MSRFQIHLKGQGLVVGKSLVNHVADFTEKRSLEVGPQIGKSGIFCDDKDIALIMVTRWGA